MISFKDFITAIIGVVCFNNGFHNLLSHPDAEFFMRWPIFIIGMGFIFVAGDSILKYLDSQNVKEDKSSDKNEQSPQ